MAISSHLRYHGPVSRSELGRILDLSDVAVTLLANALLEEGFLQEASKSTTDKRQGRSVPLLALKADAVYALGLVLRPSKTALELEPAWIDYAGKITRLPVVKIPHSDDINLVVASVLRTIDTLKHAVPEHDRIGGIVIAVPGVVDESSIPLSPKLRCLLGTKFTEQIIEHVPFPVSFYYDVNLAALSEMQQQPRLRDVAFAYLYLYAGAGSAISLHGRLHTDNSDWASEIVELKAGRLMPNARSLEYLLSTDGRLADLLEELGHARHELDHLTYYIDRRIPAVLKVIDEYCQSVADAINRLNRGLDLDEILIDFRSNILFTRLRPRLEILLQSAARQLVISTPALGHQAKLNGAALMALNLACKQLEGGTWEDL